MVDDDNECDRAAVPSAGEGWVELQRLGAGLPRHLRQGGVRQAVRHLTVHSYNRVILYDIT